MTKTRFLTSVIANSKSEPVRLPWTRGLRRAEMIARRAALVERARRRVAAAR